MPQSKTADEGLSMALHRIDALLSVAAKDLSMIEDLLWELPELYDLYDFSIDTLDGWKQNLDEVHVRLNEEHAEFERFAFDGDSIRIQDEEEEDE